MSLEIETQKLKIGMHVYFDDMLYEIEHRDISCRGKTKVGKIRLVIKPLNGGYRKSWVIRGDETVLIPDTCQIISD